MTILLIDDDVEYAQSTRLVLEREGHRVLVNNSGAEGIDTLRAEHVDLVLLDYIMPLMTGEEVVKKVRTFNDHVQVVLQTGYANESPPRELLRRLAIQGYHDKSEGPERLLMWVDVALKAATAQQMLRRSQQGLNYILGVTPVLHKIQPIDNLLDSIIQQVAQLLGASDSFFAPVVRSSRASIPPTRRSLDGFVALAREPAELTVGASSGRFTVHARVSDCVDSETFDLISETLKQSDARLAPHGTIVPLCVGPLVVGVLYLEERVEPGELELLQVFSNQAAAAVHSSQLLEMATIDPLTGTHLRRFFEQWILRELRTSFRMQQSVSLIMVDADGLKRINDTAGHLAGDQALSHLGRILRQSVRESDIVGRYGGDEFAIFMPQADNEGAQIVGRRIMAALEGACVPWHAGDLPIRASIGVSALDAHSFSSADIPRPLPKSYFEDVLKLLFGAADRALYAAKNGGRAQVVAGARTSWLPLSKPVNVATR